MTKYESLQNKILLECLENFLISQPFSPAPPPPFDIINQMMHTNSNSNNIATKSIILITISFLECCHLHHAQRD